MNHSISSETLDKIQETLKLAVKIIAKEYGNDLQKQDDAVLFGQNLQCVEMEMVM